MLALTAGLATGQNPATTSEMWDAWYARCLAQDGSGIVAEPTISVQPMDFTDCKIATPEPDTDWALAIAAGGPAVGLSAEMPAFGDSLSVEQIDSFVGHPEDVPRDRMADRQHQLPASDLYREGLPRKRARHPSDDRSPRARSDYSGR